jgi:CDP-glycerol glycerophosphotransferase (TagB/SpsB family)
VYDRLSNLVVAGTRTWGEHKAQAFGNTPEELAVTGNPRIDQFAHPATDDALLRLGLDPNHPIVLWAPTFRTVRASVRWAWQDAPAVDFSSLAQRASDLRQLVHDTGIQLVVKPHPADAANYDIPGVMRIADSDLLSSGTTLYQFMARSAALVTDYSSIWTDYLALDRPIGLYCPDLDAYRDGRGFSDDFFAYLPGPLLRDEAALFEFLRSVLRDLHAGSDVRAKVIRDLGAVTQLGATGRLMTTVAAHLPPATAAALLGDAARYGTIRTVASTG